ncbi:MAG: Hpt domain-containing protein [Hyphomicrobium sp.]
MPGTLTADAAGSQPRAADGHGAYRHEGADSDSVMDAPRRTGRQFAHLAKPAGVKPEPVKDASHDAPIDLAHLRRYTLGDAGLEREVLDLFLAQLPKTIAALSTAGDDKAWRMAAHTLKGSGRAVGAWRLAMLAEQAEHGRDSELTTLAALVKRIEDAADEARAFIGATYQS